MEIRANDRIHIFGRTGQGKTHLAMRLFDAMAAQKKIVLNSKPDRDLLNRWPAWVTRIRGTPKDGVTHVARYVPGSEKLHAWDDVLSLWTHGNLVYYFDELPNHATATEWPDDLQKIYQTGRVFGVGALACSQRPVHVPNFTISESDHIFVFFTQLKSDREKLEGATGVSWDFLRRLPPHSCGYYAQREQMTAPVILPPTWT